MDLPLPQVSSPNVQMYNATGNLQQNLRDYQLLIKQGAYRMDNYWKYGVGRFRKAPGLTLQYEITTGTDEGEATEWAKVWGDDLEVLAYGTSLAVRDTANDTTTIVSDAALTQAATDGQEYGDFFYTCNGHDGDHIGVITRILNYDGQTVNFTVGEIVTGGTSGAKAKVAYDVDAGATGILYLEQWNGIDFDDDEAITGSATGVAVANGANTFGWLELTNTKKCGVLGLANATRLLIGDTEDGRSWTQWSRVDQESGIPFAAAADWTPGTGAEDSSYSTFKNAGIVKAIANYGSMIVPLHDHGSLGFTITVVDVDGTGLVLDAPIYFQNIDWGSSRAATTTRQGVIYVNNYGVHIKQPSGQTDQGFAMIDSTISEPLGADYFKNYDTSDSDIIHDKLRDLVLVTARDDSDSNNVVLVYHLKKGLEGWTKWTKRISRLFERDYDIYCTAVDDTKVYKLDYDRGDDDGSDITTRFAIEPVLGAGIELKELQEIYLAGAFIKGESIDLNLDLQNRKGVWAETAKTYTYTTTNESLSSGGMGITGLGEGGMGADGESFTVNPDNLIIIPYPATDFVRMRLWVEITSKSIHELNFISFKAESKGLAES